MIVWDGNGKEGKAERREGKGNIIKLSECDKRKEGYDGMEREGRGKDIIEK